MAQAQLTPCIHGFRAIQSLISATNSRANRSSPVSQYAWPSVVKCWQRLSSHGTLMSVGRRARVVDVRRQLQRPFAAALEIGVPRQRWAEVDAPEPSRSNSWRSAGPAAATTSAGASGNLGRNSLRPFLSIEMAPRRRAPSAGAPTTHRRSRRRRPSRPSSRVTIRRRIVDQGRRSRTATISSTRFSESCGDRLEARRSRPMNPVIESTRVTPARAGYGSWSRPAFFGAGPAPGWLSRKARGSGWSSEGPSNAP